MLRSLVLPTSSTEETWRAIERLVDEIADLAKADLTDEHFYAQVLERTVQALAAEGAAVWGVDEHGALDCLARTKREPGENPAAEEAQREPAMAAWRRGDAHAVQTARAARLYAPVLSEQRRVAMLQVDLPPQVPLEVQESGLHVLRVVCELAGDHHRRELVRELQRRVQTEQQWRDFLTRAHGDWDLDATAYCVANEGRLVVGCDTLSVLVRRGKRYRALAASGVDVLERRARKVRALEILADACARRRQSLWWPCNAEELPPQLREALDAYLDESHARQIGVVPINEEGDDDAEIAAVIVAEDASAGLGGDQFRGGVRVLAELSAKPLIQSVRFRRMPFARWFSAAGRRPTRKDSRRWSRAVAVAGVACALIATLLFVPARLRVPAHGTLQPKNRRHVFAPESAIVDEVFVKHAQRVHVGQPLLRLSKPELGLETARTLGELQVARQQLQSVRASRFLPQGGSSDASRPAADQIAADEQRLQQQVDSLGRLLKLLRDREQALQVLSPLDGQVLTWDTDALLTARPVQTGQKLLTVADPRGPWILELRVSDRDAQHMLEARRKGDSDLSVRFSLGTNPEAAYQGRVVEIAERSELADGDTPTVKVVASFEASPVTPLRAGSEVVARIDCGKRSLGYVWLRDLWDAVRLRLFF